MADLIGDPKMDRRICCLSQGLIGRGGQEHVGGLAADLEFVEIVVLQDLDMVETAFHHRLGTGFRILVEKMLFEAARVHTDPD